MNETIGDEKEKEIFEQRLKEIASNVERNGKKIKKGKGKSKELLSELKELVKRSVNFYAAFFPERSMLREVFSVPLSAMA